MVSTAFGSDTAQIDFSVDDCGDLQIAYRCGEVHAPRKLFVALRSGSGTGSAVIPFGENAEGSTVFLPFQAIHLYEIDWQQNSATVSQRDWKNWSWSEPSAAPNEVVAAIDDSTCTLRIPLARVIPSEVEGSCKAIDVVLYAKDFSHGKPWGWFFGCSDPSIEAGEGDKYIPHYLELDHANKSAPKVTVRGRLGSDRSRLRVYQLFVRLFGNTNETRRPNGTLAQNGVGRFNDIKDAALRAIREMGFSHVWLTGVLQQASASACPEAGQPAADADLLKGLAGSPYAVEDYFDVCPDYAADPKKRLAEFTALVRRLHAHQLKVLIDFVPNHVARCYHSDIKPEIDFGATDNRSVFFDPQNNFFYLRPNENGPPLQLPTWQDGVALSPTCQLEGMNCDGRFDGEVEFGRVTGNNVVSWQPSLGDWYETVKLNYGFDFTDPQKSIREYPNARTPGKTIPSTWEKMDQVIAYWQSFGVDGFRCDMAHMEPPEFWKWLIQRARERAGSSVRGAAVNPASESFPAAQRDPATPLRSARDDGSVVFLAEAYDNDPAKVPGSDPVTSRLNDGRGDVMFDLLDAGFNGVYDDPTYRVLKGIYEGGRWANDLDTAERDPFIFENSLRYAENHDEVRLAAPNEWGGVGMNVGRPVAAILYGLSRGPLMLYNGQEVGEPASGAEGFGGDDGRTSIFDYWSMPAMVGWVNGRKYDGGKLSAEQKDLRAFYGRLVRLNGEPAFRDGALFPLNPANRGNPHFGRVAGESASGHWCYAFLRYDAATTQRFLVVANLHPRETLKNLRILLPEEALRFLKLLQPPANLQFVDRLAPEPAAFSAASEKLASDGLVLPELLPLAARYLEILPNDPEPRASASPDIRKNARDSIARPDEAANPGNPFHPTDPAATAAEVPHPPA
ncbi:MAG: hypothetical protein H0X40_07220 [Chthoniobacterales bacterium]|nr:hypothetical protein [Chthoniobacterales bacterium]